MRLGIGERYSRERRRKEAEELRLHKQTLVNMQRRISVGAGGFGGGASAAPILST